MNDLTSRPLWNWIDADFRNLREGLPLRPLLRKDEPSHRLMWLPFVLLLGSIVAVAYADHRVASISLVYLYILPLGVGATFLRKDVSYGLMAGFVLFHDYYSPRKIVHPEMRIFDNLSTLLCFTFVVYVIHWYVDQRKVLAWTVRQQRDELLQEIELAAQVQRMFLPARKPAIAGLEIAGLTRPARTVGGDYYDYIPINDHTLQMVIADVSGKGVSAALLMAATAAAMKLEANYDRDMLQIVGRLNDGIHSVSDDEHYVTLLLGEIDVQQRKLRYVNCGHNPALLFRARTGTVAVLDSSCPPIGMAAQEHCQLISVGLDPGDVLLFYTDGVTEARNGLDEEFGTERLSAALKSDASLSAERLMTTIFSEVENFCRHFGFKDDATILVVKCTFDGSFSAIR